MAKALPKVAAEIITEEEWAATTNAAGPTEEYLYQEQLDALREGKPVKLTFSSTADRQAVTMSLARRAAPLDGQHKPLPGGFKLTHRDPVEDKEHNVYVRVFHRKD